MYAHQVIEELDNYCINYDFPTYTKTFFYMISDRIKNSQKFHCGSFEDLLKLINPSKEDEMFVGKYGEWIDLPYECCWFDFTRNVEILTKGGILAIRLEHNFFMTFSFTYCGKSNAWRTNFLSHFISVGIPVKDNKNAVKFLMESNINIPKEVQQKNNAIVSFCYLPELYGKHNDIFNAKNVTHNDIALLDNNSLTVLNSVLMLLGCKNISSKKVCPSSALNKKRAKKNKQPLYSYKTLVVNLDISKQEQKNSSIKNATRLHLCMGHFKTFKEKPLFGKITGRYWWQPYVRGDKKKGVVMKDYKIAA